MRIPSLLFTLSLLPSLVGAASADLGAMIAQQGSKNGGAPCLACHGADGAGVEASGYPRLAGLNADYIAHQLRSFQGGQRVNPVMTPMAAPLSDEEIAAVAAYYSAMPIPASAKADAAADSDLGSAPSIVRYGDWSGRGLPACSQCHGPDGNGIGGQFPGLAGQHATYLTAQLKAWRDGSRFNDALGLMKSVAGKLTDAEITELASYYATLPAGHSTPAQNAPKPSTDSGNTADLATRDTVVADQGRPAPGRAPGDAGYFAPPAHDTFPEGPFGDTIRQGEAIFKGTNMQPVSAPYVGNDQACGNCHLDAGRLANSAPMWAAWVSYPAYRSKNKKVNTFVERIQGCFTYSMNAQASKAGAAPASDSDPIVSLVAYSYWLAQKAPTGDTTIPGRGYPKLDDPADGLDPQRGAQVYAQNCALCHGADGSGVSTAQGKTLFPPLWGADSFNWGAGMHKIDTAAAFIRHNMPLGRGETLTEQQAWDVAAFMNSHERPQDPRFAGDLAATTKAHHGGKYDYYGTFKTAEGKLLGEDPATR